MSTTHLCAESTVYKMRGERLAPCWRTGASDYLFLEYNPSSLSPVFHSSWAHCSTLRCERPSNLASLISRCPRRSIVPAILPIRSTASSYSTSSEGLNFRLLFGMARSFPNEDSTWDHGNTPGSCQVHTSGFMRPAAVVPSASHATGQNIGCRELWSGLIPSPPAFSRNRLFIIEVS